MWSPPQETYLLVRLGVSVQRALVVVAQAIHLPTLMSSQHTTVTSRSSKMKLRNRSSTRPQRDLLDYIVITQEKQEENNHKQSNGFTRGGELHIQQPSRFIKVSNWYQVFGQVDHELFKDMNTSTVHPSIRPGRKSEVPAVTDLRVLQYCPGGKVQYKLKFSGFARLPLRLQKEDPASLFPSLVKNPWDITLDDRKDLQSLKPMMRKKIGAGVNLSQLCDEEGKCLEPSPSCLPADCCIQTAPNRSTGDPLLDRFYSEWPVSQWDFFTDDYFQNDLNKHWLTYPPPSEQAHLAVLAIYTLMAVVSLTGNAVVVFMICRCRSLRTPSNLLVLNLAISDFFMMSKTPIAIYNSYKEGPALGSWGCKIYGFLGGLTGVGSIMTLAAIALDRYYVIAYPLNRDVHTTRIRALIWIVLIWIYAFSFSVVPIANIGIKPFVSEGYLTTCGFDYVNDDYTNRLFIFGFFVAAWVVPFIIICFSYIGICRAVLVGSMATRMGQEKEKRKKELKLAVVVISVVGLWFLSWTPYATVALLGLFGRKDLISPTVSMIPSIFCKTAACIDPFVYSLNHPRLRQELFRIFCPKKYEMNRIETQKSLYNLKESRSSLNLKEMKTKANQPEEVDLEDVGEPWKKHRGTLTQLDKSEQRNRTSSVRSEVITM